MGDICGCRCKAKVSTAQAFLHSSLSHQIIYGVSLYRSSLNLPRPFSVRRRVLLFRRKHRLVLISIIRFTARRPSSIQIGRHLRACNSRCSMWPYKSQVRDSTDLPSVYPQVLHGASLRRFNYRNHVSVPRIMSHELPWSHHRSRALSTALASANSVSLLSIRRRTSVGHYLYS